MAALMNLNSETETEHMKEVHTAVVDRHLSLPVPGSQLQALLDLYPPGPKRLRFLLNLKGIDPLAAAAVVAADVAAVVAAAVAVAEDVAAAVHVAEPCAQVLQPYPECRRAH